MKHDITDYRTIPVLASYVDRIGAEQIGVGRFIVKGESSSKLHYYTERCLITIRPNGQIFCRDNSFAPTKDEAAAITGVVSQIKWPENIAITKAQSEAQRKKVKCPPELWFEFWDLNRRKIVMIQQRMEQKAYVPWTLFNDKIWRIAEPTNLKGLPMWKPPVDRKKRIMAHEGAKVARFCDDLVNSNEPKFRELRKTHPWFEFLKDFEHWGWIGGALAPERTDYAELRKASGGKLVRFVCDNDHEGKGALGTISRNYRGLMLGLYFDNNFPEGFDCADPLPEKLYEDGVYVGAMMQNMDWIPATWATDSKVVEKTTVVTIRREFSKTIAHIVRPDVFIYEAKPDKLWTASEFNDKCRPFSDVDDTVKLVRADSAIKTSELTYLPWERSGPYLETDGTNKFNCHKASIVEPEKGSAKPWFEYLEHTFPDEGDRELVKKFIATLIARPQNKMAFGMLLRSETQGVGKSALGDHILAPILGHHNVSFPSEQQVVEMAFNDYLAFKRLIFIHEIYTGASAKAYNKMKPLFTDAKLTINQKYLAPFQIDNCVSIIACSNSAWAMKVRDDDRRLMIPKVAEKLKSHDWWKGFHHWLYREKGHGIILRWAKEHGAYFSAGTHAPNTKAKEEFIRAQFSEGMDWLNNVMDGFKEDNKSSDLFFLDTDLREALIENVYGGNENKRIESRLTIKNIAKKAGLFVSERRAHIKEWGCREIGPNLICIRRVDAEELPGNLAIAGRKPFDIKSWLSKSKRM